MALQEQVSAVEHMETCGHWLVVAYALRIVAFYDVGEFIGKSNTMLVDNLEIADYVDFNIRGNHGNAIECRLREKYIGHLYYALLSHSLAVEVISDSHTALEALDAKQIHHLKQCLGWNMVDNSTVFKSGNGKFFLIAVHK